MNLIVLEESDVRDSGDVTVSGARAAHLLNVLAVTPGAAVRIGLLDGPQGTGVVTAIGNGSVTLRCAFEPAAPPRPRVDLLLAVPRPKVLRRLWAQFAAVGIGQIILTNATRVERNYFDTHVLEATCYRPLLIEGLQQARDTRLPTVTVHRQFRVLIEDRLDGLFPDGLRVVADPRAQTPIRDAIGDHAGRRVLVAIGPEGGWNDFELTLLGAHGFRAIGLGARTLRVDTACVALLAIVNDALGNG